MTPPKVAFAIGRPVGTAVTRNRVRRRLKAVLRDSSVPAGLLLVGADRAAPVGHDGYVRRKGGAAVDAVREMAALQNATA